MKLLKEDIPEDLCALFELVGVDNFIEILKLYGGERFYLPSYLAIMREPRNREIRKKYNGKNTKQLALEYKISTIQVKNIVSIE